MAKVVITSTLKSDWIPEELKKSDRAMLQMATDIHRRSAILAPKDSRNLVNSGRIKRVSNAEYEVSYGGSGNGFSVPYARRRHNENKKNPQTLKYLERAGDAVARAGVGKYIK